jgi:hypothetical protein
MVRKLKALNLIQKSDPQGTAVPLMNGIITMIHTAQRKPPTAQQTVEDRQISMCCRFSATSIASVLRIVSFGCSFNSRV